ncbi:MAG: class I SAM-dependent methyltransferase [Candidatus Njordarchaeia archaeon]
MSENLLREKLRNVDRAFAEMLLRIPPWRDPYLPSYWLHIQMIERYKVLLHANITEGMNILEIGCGAHAIATVPLAYMVGACGRIVAIDRERWHFFDMIVESTGLQRRVIPISCNARKLPFKYQWFDLGVIIHGIRSLENEENIIWILKEMFRVTPRIFIAETLPIAKTKGQEAHLEMYNLREEIFEALSGRKDDIHYFPFDKLIEFVKSAGGEIINTKVIDVELPHHLAFIPKEYIEKIKDVMKKRTLMNRWKIAYEKLKKYGEEHPPVGIVLARKR